MALRLKNRVQETTTTAGTGTVTLSGSAPTGFQTFSSALSDGDTTYYQITDGTDWEIGLGTFISATNELQRTEVFESTNSDAKVDWSAGDKDVFVVFPANKVHATDAYDAVTDLPLTGNVIGDQAYVTANNALYMWNGGGWYSIALLNLTPTITTQPNANYGLGTQGADLQVTVEATDPEGFPITWSANTVGMDGLATLSQAGNVFTFTPSTDAVDQGQSFTATFIASDGTNTAVSNQATFTIGIDNLADPSIGTLTITSPTGQAVFIAGLSELWKDVTLSIGTSSTNGAGNSTFVDRSSNAHTVGLVGSPVQTAFHPYLDNWSVEFDGTSDWIQTSASNATDMGTGDFTIECWFYRTATAGNGFHDIILSNREDATFTSGEWSVFVDPNDGGAFGFQANGSNVVSGGICVTGQWHHVAVVRSSGTISLYVDGTSVNSASNTAQVGTTSKILNVGAFGDGGYKCEGYVSNVRLVNGTALYTSTFTPPTEKLTAVTGTTLLTCQSNRFIDNSTNDHTITANGDPKVSAYNPFGQGSEYAPGENKGSIEFENANQIQPTGSIIDVGTGDFTIEFWSYGIPTSDAILDTRVGTGNTTGALIQARDTGYRYQSTNSLTSASGVAPFVKQWLHFAAVRNSGTVTIYHNGVGEQVTTGDTTNFTQTTVTVGANSGLGYDVAEGYCSDLRITKSAVYTADFTPPTAPVGNTNASLYLPMDNAGIFDKTGNAILKPNSSTATSTTQTKYASSSINFPTNSTLSVLYGSWMTLSDNNFTMEMWVYPTDSSGGTLWSFGYSAENRLDFGWQSSGGIRLLIETANTSNTVFTSSDAVSTYLNSWVHIAVVRVGTGFTLYVNGTSTATGTSSLSIVEDTTDGWTFGGREFSSDYTGGNPSDPFTGYLENIQFSKTAKYTGNFTPPTEEQGRTYQAPVYSDVSLSYTGRTLAVMDVNSTLYNGGSPWKTYTSNLPAYLANSWGTTQVNQGDQTLTTDGLTRIWLAKDSSWVNPNNLSEYTLYDTLGSGIFSGTSDTLIYYKDVGAGTHMLATYSAMYFFQTPDGTKTTVSYGSTAHPDA